ncbi:MAG: hypothetical protein ACTHU0_21750 [Kofleriaceae bacterium]
MGQHGGEHGHETAEETETGPDAGRLAGLIARLDAELDEEIARRRAAAQSLSDISSPGGADVEVVRALHAQSESGLWRGLIQGIVILAHDAARAFGGEPQKMVVQPPREYSFDGPQPALGFLLLNETQLGGGTVTLGRNDGGEREETAVERALGDHLGISYTPVSSRSSAGPADTSGSARGQRTVELRVEVSRALAAAKLGVVDLQMLALADVGVQKASEKGEAMALEAYIRRAIQRSCYEHGQLSWPLLAPFAARIGANALHLQRFAEGKTQIEPAIIAAFAAQFPRGHAELVEIAVADAAARPNIEVLEKPGQFVRKPIGQVTYRRLRPLEIAARMVFALGHEPVSAAAVGKRIAKSRRTFAEKLAGRFLIPPTRPRDEPKPPPQRTTHEVPPRPRVFDVREHLGGRNSG